MTDPNSIVSEVEQRMQVQINHLRTRINNLERESTVHSLHTAIIIVVLVSIVTGVFQ